MKPTILLEMADGSVLRPKYVPKNATLETLQQHFEQEEEGEEEAVENQQPVTTTVPAGNTTAEECLVMPTLNFSKEDGKAPKHEEAEQAPLMPKMEFFA